MEASTGKGLHVSNPVITAFIYLTHRQLQNQGSLPPPGDATFSWVLLASLVVPTQLHPPHLNTGKAPEVRP